MTKEEFHKGIEKVGDLYERLKGLMLTGNVDMDSWALLQELRNEACGAMQQAREYAKGLDAISTELVKLPVSVLNKEDGREELTYMVVKRTEIDSIVRWWDHRDNQSEDFNGRATALGLKSGREYTVLLKPAEVLKLVWGVKLSDVPGTLRAERPADDNEE